MRCAGVLLCILWPGLAAPDLRQVMCTRVVHVHTRQGLHQVTCLYNGSQHLCMQQAVSASLATRPSSRRLYPAHQLAHAPVLGLPDLLLQNCAVEKLTFSVQMSSLKPPSIANLMPSCWSRSPMAAGPGRRAPT